MFDDRIENTKNRVFVQDLAFGKDNRVALKTNSSFVYIGFTNSPNINIIIHIPIVIKI